MAGSVPLASNTMSTPSKFVISSTTSLRLSFLILTVLNPSSLHNSNLELSKSEITILDAPAYFNTIAVIIPMGPAPITTVESSSLNFDWWIDLTITAKGSINAATSSETFSSTLNRTLSSTKAYSAIAPSTSIPKSFKLLHI